MSTRPVRTAVDGPFATPWGKGLVTVSGGRLVGVELPPLGQLPAAQPGDSPVDPEDQEALKLWGAELEAYFRGERLSWSAEEIGLEEWSAEGFTRAVYETLLGVPAGLTVSYGALAEMAGFPRAARAVGTAMASNPIPIVIPCHRVILSDGSLGRYGNDSTWKERLLAHEQRYAGQGGGRR
jgi:methylated-DNA-[protein]-cysteine S-methyltransferase